MPDRLFQTCMPKRKRKQADGKGDDDRARLQGLDERAPGEKEADSDAEMALALALSLEAQPPMDHSEVAARKPGPAAAAQQSVKGKGGVRKKGRSEQSALPATPAEMQACFRQLSGATGGSVITEHSISHVSESVCSQKSCCRVTALPAQPNVETVAFCRLTQFKKTNETTTLSVWSYLPCAAGRGTGCGGQRYRHDDPCKKVCTVSWEHLRHNF